VGACTNVDTQSATPTTTTPSTTTPATTSPATTTPPVVVPPVVTSPAEQTQPVKEEKVTICHIPPGNPENPQTIEIAKSALSAHLAHGDHVGACTNVDMQSATPTTTTPTSPATTTPPVVVPPVVTPPVEEKVTICHKPPGNPENAHTLEISKSALSAHLAHGDHVGECTNSDTQSATPPVETPANETPAVTPPATTPAVVSPPVVEERITICHKPPGNRSNAQTIEISKSALSAHLAHGDHVGECTDADVQVIQAPEQKAPVTITPPVTNTPPATTAPPVTTTPPATTPPATAPGQERRPLERARPVQPATTAPPETTPPPASTIPTAPKREEMVTICHKNGDGTSTTLTVPQSEVQNHMQHGDHVGVCTPDEMNPH